MRKINSSMLFNVGVEVNSVSNGISVQGKKPLLAIVSSKVRV